MLKLLGAVMIILGCGSAGFAVVAAYRYQEQTLLQLLRALEYMTGDLQYRMTPLPELCLTTSEVCTGCIKNVFRSLSFELESQVVPDATACMHAALTKYTNIPARVHKVMTQMSNILGRFDLPGQLQGLESIKKQTEFELESLRRNHDGRLRGYQTMGLCAGAALVVMFL